MRLIDHVEGVAPTEAQGISSREDAQIPQTIKFARGIQYPGGSSASQDQDARRELK